MKHAKPYILTNPQDNEDKIVILGNYISLTDFFPFEKNEENNPLYINHPQISDWVDNNIKKASQFHSNDPIMFFESKDVGVNSILAKVLTEKEDLKLLSQNEDSVVRMIVAKHNIPDILDVLSNDESIYVRKEVAKHNNHGILLKMIEHDDNKNNLVLKNMAKNDNKVILDKILDILEENSQIKYKDSIFSEIIKHGYVNTFDRILSNPYHSIDNINEICKKEAPEVHNKIIDELLESPYEFGYIIGNIASHNNKNCLDKIIDLAEKEPVLQNDYFYLSPLISIAEQDIKEYQIRLAKMDVEEINRELEKSKHQEVIDIVSKKKPNIQNEQKKGIRKTI